MSVDFRSRGSRIAFAVVQQYVRNLLAKIRQYLP